MSKQYKQLQKDGKISNFVDGLYIQNGREMNARADGMTGIARASMYRHTYSSSTKTHIYFYRHPFSS